MICNTQNALIDILVVISAVQCTELAFVQPLIRYIFIRSLAQSSPQYLNFWSIPLVDLCVKAFLVRTVSFLLKNCQG